ncbi:MAG: hypothetical protein V3W34_06410 [Phycisphaerae bacterium]
MDRRRHGTVLVMVVAMLAMLFMVGATFLSTVTFESQAIEDAADAQKQASVINRLLREVRTVLRQGFLGHDGLAWNRDSESGGAPASPIGADLYGEVPGVHPLLASIEPYDAENPAPGSWYFFSATDLQLALQGIPLTEAVDNDTDSPGTFRGTNLVYINQTLGTNHPLPLFVDNGLFVDQQPVAADPGEPGEGNSVLRRSALSGDPPLRLHRRDADGDGVWDSYEYELPLDRFPNSVRGDLADRSRAADFNFDSNADPDALYYALRVIPHGAMIDVGHAHETLVSTLPNVVLGVEYVQGPYVPEGEEVSLRRRFLLPPRDIPLSQLQSRIPPDLGNFTGGQIPKTLYQSFVADADWPSFESGEADARWWPIDTGENGDDLSAMLPGSPGAPPGWLNWMDPFDTGPTGMYDFRHLITTVSHDDNLMRMGRETGATNSDWIEDIVDPTNLIDPANFAIDEWPDVADPDNALNGRLKVSLPGLIEKVLLPEGLPWFGEGEISGMYDGREIDALRSDSGLSSTVRDRFIRTIQDAFLLMLRNVDDLIMPQADREKAAAALTANLIDFADFDGDDGDGAREDGEDDEPTKVDVRGIADGLPTGDAVYGLERQPYITEVYADNVGNDPAQSAYAVELYNPYDVAITLNDYLIGTDETDSDGSNATLSGVVNAHQFLTIASRLGNIPSVSGDTDQVNSLLFGESDAQVMLLRRVAVGTGDETIIVVDQMRCDLETEFAVVNSGAHGVARESAADQEWLVPIPRDTATAPPGTLGVHAGAGTSLRPVEVQFADTSDVATAFPTTGTLLLLLRYANTESTDAGGPGIPFTASLVGSGVPPPLEERIDNARMPLFDQNQLAQPPGGPFALSIPWGQLVFDYFTALPLTHDYDPDDPSDVTPTIDQGGLRVHGRIDINSAPWSVLAGLPMVPADRIPLPFRATIKQAAGLDDTKATPIGDPLAQSIVAYREARQMTGTGDFAQGVSGGGDRLREGATGNPFTGFLTIGELANVRRDGGGVGAFDIDSGVIGSADEDYVKAVAVLVALGDWVTTRSHVFTVYGTLRGAGEKSSVDQKAIRFQETVDRLPCFFTNRLPRRVGPRVVGPYAQASRD